MAPAVSGGQKKAGGRRKKRPTTAEFHQRLRHAKDRKVSLNPTARAQIVDVLGRVGGTAADVEAALTEIESILRRDEYTQIHFASWARPSTVHDDARRLAKAAQALLTVLEELDAYTVKQLTVVTSGVWADPGARGPMRVRPTLAGEKSSTPSCARSAKAPPSWPWSTPNEKRGGGP
jgi:hypothetical protein